MLAWDFRQTKEPIKCMHSRIAIFKETKVKEVKHDAESHRWWLTGPRFHQGRVAIFIMMLSAQGHLMILVQLHICKSKMISLNPQCLHLNSGKLTYLLLGAKEEEKKWVYLSSIRDQAWKNWFHLHMKTSNKLVWQELGALNFSIQGGTEWRTPDDCPAFCISKVPWEWHLSSMALAGGRSGMDALKSRSLWLWWSAFITQHGICTCHPEGLERAGSSTALSIQTKTQQLSDC